jgi:signal peptidase I
VIAAAGLAAATAVLAVGLWAVGTRLRLTTVDGPSMAPGLADGDRVLVRRVPARALRRGDVVLVAADRAGGRRWLIKRVAALPGDPLPAGVGSPAAGRVPEGTVAVLGDNPDASIDSRDFGCVPADRVFGRMVRRLPPAA